MILRGNSSHFTSLSHEVQYELGDIASCYRNVLDGTSNDVSVRAGDNVRDTITGIDNRSSECAIGDSVGGPGGGQSEHGLDGDVQTLDIERFEENLRSLFTVLRRIERRFSLDRK